MEFNELLVDALGNAVTMTAAFNKLPEMPTKLRSRKLFREFGIKTTTVALQYTKGRIQLVRDHDRNEVAAPRKRDRKNAKILQCTHLPVTGELLADDLQNVATFGGGVDGSGWMNAVNDEQQRMKNDLMATIEFHQLGAVQGIIRDADGSVIYDLYQEFGVERNLVEVNSDDAKFVGRTMIINAIDRGEQKLGAQMISGWEVVCGLEWFNWFTSQKSVKEAYAGYQLAQEKIGGDVRNGFQFGGATFYSYSTKLGNVNFVDPNEAHLYPIGGQDIFIMPFAPANWVEATNTVGLPYYSRAEAKKMGMGFDLGGQSNPLALCMYPEALTTFRLKQVP